MSEFPDHPAWDFITRLYARPEVAPACLALQERHDVDVTLMLFCLWRGPAGGTVPDSAMMTLVAAAHEWHAATVLPLRAARRWLKQKEGVASLYRTVLSAEIDCEHGELLMLAELADSLCGVPAGHAPAEAMADNLGAFTRQWGLEPDEQDRTDLSVILGAAVAEAETALALPRGPVT